MSEFSSWLQSNWYGLGNLLVELAFLIAGVWFARNILNAMRSFQEQVGALVKLSISATPVERQSSSSSDKHPLADASPYWLTPSETQTACLSEPTERGPGQFAVAWHRSVLWLQAPMNSTEVVPWRRVIRWLQAPIGG